MQRLASLCAGGLLLGCGPQVISPAGSGTGGAHDSGDASSLSDTASGSGPPSATTGMGPTTAPPDTSVSTAGDDSDDAGEGFFPLPDFICGAPAPEGTSFHCLWECDPFAQDCPEGEKCMPWANDGGPVLNSFRCSPVAANPGQAGEACLVEFSAVTGIDDCDRGLMCYWVDGETLEGTCVPLCAGSEADPTCAGDATCVQSSESLALCLDACDPLSDDCAPGVCLSNTEGFVCTAVDPGDVPPGMPCDFVEECAPGSACLAAGSVGECEGAACCTSHCDLTAAAPDTPCLPGQTCLPWWERGQAPDEWAHVGVCALAQ